jgi:ADP-heptose:LPS heptosyltransferase
MVANEILEGLLFLANQVLADKEPTDGGLNLPFRKPKAALIVPSLFIGDNVLLTPLIRNLRRNFGPDTRLEIVCPSVVKPFHETLPWLDAVHAEKNGATRNPVLFLKSQAYDTIILCRYSFTWANAALRAEIPQRIGYDLERLGLQGFKHWGRCLTHAIPSTSVFDQRPQVEIYLDLLRQLGLNAENPIPECVLTEPDHQKAEQLLEGSRNTPRILIQAGAGSPGKQWPIENWQAVLAGIRQYWPQADFFAIGGKREQTLYLEMEQQFLLHNFCGKTSLRESIALISRMDMVITLDTSVAHLAAVAKVPRLVVLYGPTNHAKWRPNTPADSVLSQVFMDLPCRPCMARTCAHKSCLKLLPARQVLQAIQDAFQQKPLHT